MDMARDMARDTQVSSHIYIVVTERHHDRVPAVPRSVVVPEGLDRGQTRPLIILRAKGAMQITITVAHSSLMKQVFSSLRELGALARARSIGILSEFQTSLIVTQPNAVPRRGHRDTWLGGGQRKDWEFRGKLGLRRRFQRLSGRVMLSPCAS